MPCSQGVHISWALNRALIFALVGFSLIGVPTFLCFRYCRFGWSAGIRYLWLQAPTGNVHVSVPDAPKSARPGHGGGRPHSGRGLHPPQGIHLHHPRHREERERGVNPPPSDLTLHTTATQTTSWIKRWISVSLRCF